MHAAKDSRWEKMNALCARSVCEVVVPLERTDRAVLPATAHQRYVRPVSIETLVGTTLAGYTVRGKVGEGGTSTVFRADHPQHGTVALKVLREKLQHDKTAVARFLREAQFGVRVEHPNIIRTLDYGQSTGALLPGDRVGPTGRSSTIRRRTGTPAREVADIMRRSAGRSAHMSRDRASRSQAGERHVRSGHPQVKLLTSLAADTMRPRPTPHARGGFWGTVCMCAELCLASS